MLTHDFHSPLAMCLCVCDSQVIVSYSVGSPPAEEAVEVGCFVARAAVEVKGLDWLRPARYPPPGEDNMADSRTSDSGETVCVPPRSQDTGPRGRRIRKIVTCGRSHQVTTLCVASLTYIKLLWGNEACTCFIYHFSHDNSNVCFIIVLYFMKNALCVNECDADSQCSCSGFYL